MQEFCLNCMAEQKNPGRFCPKCGFDRSAYQIESHHLIPGTMLRGRYRIGKVLGEGGFGITYVGWDTVLNLKVAVKEFYMTGYVSRMNTYSPSVQVSMSTHGEVFQKNRDRFLDEARVLARFAEEDGIVGIRDFFQENNTAYIVMSFLSGITLKEYLKQQGKLSWQKTYEVLRPVLLSLSEVHKQGIIHRDISPDNIMMTDRGQVKLLDFGAAREYSGSDAHSLSIILKPGFAPEEQYRTKGQQGPWTDVYALCATMYRCLTGITPEESMERTYRDTLRPPHELGDCPLPVSAVLMKGLSVYAQDRYASVSELLAALQNAGDPNLTVAMSDGAPPLVDQRELRGVKRSGSPKRKPLPLLLAVVAVLLAALVAVLVLLPKEQPSGKEEPEEPPTAITEEAPEAPEEPKEPKEPEPAEPADDTAQTDAEKKPGERPETAEPETEPTAEATPPEEEPSDEEPPEEPSEEEPLEETGTAEYDFPMLDPQSTYYADIYLGSRGTITVLLDQNAAPVTAANFVHLAKSGFYDNLTFHRIMEGFMMQGGDPAADGTGGSGTTIEGEFAANGYDNPLSHTRGAISMARGTDYNSASSQFFIVHEDSTFLDGNYAVFGYVVSGMDIVDTICEEAMPVDQNGTIPLAAQPMITFLTIRDSGSGPQPQVEVPETEPDPEPEPEPEPEPNPLEGLDVEAEVTAIRDETVAYLAKVNAGELSAVTVRGGVIAYVDRYGQVWMIEVSNGTDNSPYARTYYFDGSNVMFAYYTGANSHRCYFYDGKMFRWRHTPNAYNNDIYTDHDLENSEAFLAREALVLEDVRYYLAELEAMGYYA